MKHTGRVLHALVGAEAKVTRGEEPVVTIPGMTGPLDDEATVSDTEADEMEEHLRGLGYLE